MLWWKHPHVRGEDARHAHGRKTAAETPPRAWGRLRILVNNAAVDGNTPTCVGKTRPGIIDAKSGQKHPHVRGEDARLAPSQPSRLETPPRAWGRLCRPRKPIPTDETPPRAWGRLECPNCQERGFRNTPTCVGKTPAGSFGTFSSQKHPHVRGEDCYLRKRPCYSGETPPRAWGRQRSFSF